MSFGLTRHRSGAARSCGLDDREHRQLRDVERSGNVDESVESRDRTERVDERRERIEEWAAFDLGVYREDVQLIIAKRASNPSERLRRSDAEPDQLVERRKCRRNLRYYPLDTIDPGPVRKRAAGAGLVRERP